MSYSDYVYRGSGTSSGSGLTLTDSSLLTSLLEGVEALTQMVETLDTKVDQWSAANNGLNPQLVNDLQVAKNAYDLSRVEFVNLQSAAATLVSRTQFLSVQANELVVSENVRLAPNMGIKFPSGDTQFEAYTQEDSNNLTNMSTHFGPLPANPPAVSFQDRLAEMENKTQYLTVSGGDLHCSQNFVLADGKKIKISETGAVFFGGLGMDKSSVVAWTQMESKLNETKSKLDWFTVSGGDLICNSPFVAEEIVIRPTVGDPKLHFETGGRRKTQIVALGSELTDLETRTTVLETKANTFSVANGVMTFTTPLEVPDLTVTTLTCDSVTIGGVTQTLAFQGVADPVYASLTDLDNAIYVTNGGIQIRENVTLPNLTLESNGTIVYSNGGTQRSAPPLQEIGEIASRLAGITSASGKTYINELVVKSADGLREIRFEPSAEDPAGSDINQVAAFNDSSVANVRAQRFITHDFTGDAAWGLGKMEGDEPDTIDSPTTQVYTIHTKEGGTVWPKGWYVLNSVWGVAGLSKLIEMTMVVKYGNTELVSLGFVLDGSSTQERPSHTVTIPHFRFALPADSSITLSFIRGMRRASGTVMALEEYGFCTLEYLGLVN